MTEILLALSMGIIAGAGAWLLGTFAGNLIYGQAKIVTAKTADEQALEILALMPDDLLVEAILTFKA